MPPWALAAQEPRGSAQSLRARGAHVEASLRVRGRIGSCARILHLARGAGSERTGKGYIGRQRKKEPCLKAFRVWSGGHVEHYHSPRAL